jgi:ribosomal protein S18 acetylase RimI-like enzyme
MEERAHLAEDGFVQDCAAWLRRAMRSGRWVVAVAVSEERSLCGCMYLQFVDKVPIPGEIQRAWGYVTNAYVSIEQRGHGIGRELLNLLIDVAQARNLEFLIVWPSQEAVPLYERAGFRPAFTVHDRANDYPPLELEL